MLRMILTLVIGYLLGSISTGVLLSRLVKNSDIRSQGSGNSGTTNMLRVHGRAMALSTFLGDILKGIIAVFVGKALVGGTLGGLLGVAGAVLGHSYPIFFGFKGGKGIATSFGALLFVFPWQALTAFCVFLLIVFFTHYVSAGSIAAAVTFPLLVVLSTPYAPLISGLSILIGGFVIYRHRGNIVRLVQHRESRLDFSSLTGKKK